MNVEAARATLDLQSAIDTVQKERDYADLYPLGVCQNCPRPAEVEGYDGYGYCKGCARAIAKSILIVAASARHCSTPAQRKARAKRRKKRKDSK